MNNEHNSMLKIAGAALIGALFELLLLYIFYNVMENMGGGSLFLTVIISVICFFIVPSISKASSDIEVSTRFGIAQGVAMIIPVLSLEDLSFAWTLNVALMIVAVIFYLLAILDVVSIGEWKGSFTILTISLCLQSLYAFSIGTMGAIIIAIFFALTQAGRKRR
ncbi:hypothetical protein [Butyrivibrio sp.]|uniref:hypothetical protein n=1 Tax=Butyrivibrio sp. TaxID=28121 RepID=UPI0025B98AA2|nr:hypothetical protein [Butyrivibrio sp.]MBQ9301664.1 hypothetical protein [Butyrivibrio sp.]